MTTCLDAATLQAYLDGELADDDMRRAARHLARCPACRTALDTLAADVALLREVLDELAPRSAPAPDFRPSVLRSPAGRRDRWREALLRHAVWPARRARGRWLGGSLATAALVLLSVLLAHDLADRDAVGPPPGADGIAAADPADIYANPNTLWRRRSLPIQILNLRTGDRQWLVSSGAADHGGSVAGDR